MFGLNHTYLETQKKDQQQKTKPCLISLKLPGNAFYGKPLETLRIKVCIKPRETDDLETLYVLKK